MKSELEDIAQFLNHYEVNLGRAAGTSDAYFQQLKRFTEYQDAQGSNLLDATPEDIELFAGIYLHSLGISPRSRRVAIAALRGFFRWASRKGLISSNPADSLRYPKTGRSLPSTMPRKYAEAILMQCKLTEFGGIRNAAIIAVLTGCGLRVSGVSRLNEGDLISEVVDGKESAFLRVTEKGGHQRMVPLPDDAYLYVRAYLGHEYLDNIDRSLPNGDRVLFVNTKNRLVASCDHVGELRRLSTTGIRSMILALGEKAGVPKKYCHPHAFRHLYGTELVESDVDLLTVGQLMGHQDAGSTKVYIHLSTRRLRKAVDQGNPLAKMRTAMSGLAHLLRR